jgi:hypothetical protein
MLSAPKFKRGNPFDWLYDQMVTTGRLESVMSKSLDLPDLVWHRLRSATDHELRAALICLLTAALAENGTAAIIGEAEGSFWLPPSPLWQRWAREGLKDLLKKRMPVAFASPETATAATVTRSRSGSSKCVIKRA